MRPFDPLRPKRPVTPALQALYDDGHAAGASGTENPYNPPQRRGDDLRSHIWGQGKDDRVTADAIDTLV